MKGAGVRDVVDDVLRAVMPEYLGSAGKCYVSTEEHGSKQRVLLEFPMGQGKRVRVRLDPDVAADLSDLLDMASVRARTD